MMIKCQKCGFENQMGSIFCRDCGEKLDMNAIDPNKLQKDVNKEKNIKLAKKRIKGLISGLITLLVIAAFFFVILFRGRQENSDYVVNTDGAAAAEAPAEGENAGAPAVSEEEKKALSKYDQACKGTKLGEVTFSYPELNLIFKKKVIEPLAAEESNAKITSFELAFDPAKNQSVVYIWFKVANKVPMLYTLHSILAYNPPNPENKEEKPALFNVDVKRLDIGLLPLFVSTKPFLKGFSSMLEGDDVRAFFKFAQRVEFGENGMLVEFKRSNSGDSEEQESTPPPQRSPQANNSNPLRKSIDRAEQSNAKHNNDVSAAMKDSSKTPKASSSKKKTEEKQLTAEEEERKRKAEEYRQQKKEQEEERKRKAAEEAERKKQEREAEKQRQKEENDRRNEERRREREERRNNNYNNNNSRSSRSSRNNRW